MGEFLSIILRFLKDSSMGQVLSIILRFLSRGGVGNGSAEKRGGISEPLTSATAGLSLTIEEDAPTTTAAALPQNLLTPPHSCRIDVEQYYCSYTGDDTSHHQLQEDILGSAETPGGTSEPLVSATAGVSSTIEEEPPATTAAALPQKLLVPPHFCSIDVEQYYCSYTGDDTSHHQLQEDTLGSAKTPGGTLESVISASDGLSSTTEHDPPFTTASALSQKFLTTPHFSSIDVEQYYSYTEDDTSHHQLLEDILALSRLESSLSDEDDYISSKTEEVDQDTRIVEVLCQAVNDFESEPGLWMKQYSSRQKILLVGEGDFSFSASLAAAFGSATNIVATSLDSEGFLRRNYRSSMANIGCLKGRGAKVFHSVDATEMAENFILQGMKFDRVVFNFPLAGFFPDESRKSQLQRNKNLIRLFMRNAKKMIVEAKGEIHITHKSNGFFAQWDLQQLASSEGLQLKQEEHFNFRDYPGYRTKYGFGGDKNFNCNPSKSYTFGLIKINA